MLPVECQVVPRSGGDADVREVVLHRDLGDERLRAVSARHSDHIGGARRLMCESPQIVAAFEDDRLDPPPPSLVYKIELLDLSASRLRVHE